MQQGEDKNFLRFAAFLKILVANSIRLDTIPTVRKLLEDYLLDFSKFYGSDHMKPNHHWAVHIPDQVLDLGPLNGFWVFLTERLNKILKNHNSNNWTGGRLEVSMMREFNRTSKLSSVVRSVHCFFVQHAAHPLQLDQVMYDAVGSDGSISRLEREFTSDGARVVPGPVVKTNSRMAEEDILRFGLFKYYNRDQLQVHFARNTTPHTTMLSPYVDFYEFALLDGKRVTPTARSRRNTAGSSLVQIRHRHEGHDEAWAGEVRHIFQHRQTGVTEPNNTLFAQIEWMKRSDLTPLDEGEFPWNEFPQLGVDTWEYNTYADPKDQNFPLIVMRMDQIHCQISRGKISHTDPPLWMTATMDRVRCLIFMHCILNLLIVPCFSACVRVRRPG
ncbi:hypothetical protein C8F04DRAFT_948905 [Mycena alexandri]|uniref:Uncharacterized protein n=1 Tax=Mycena alexandri TaxID=1745969 RepID=A0AAD6X7Y2_9AGAR|nr:hypothetical protein C8F04DRAFT_948905 [Mycena alexandri]